MHISCLSVLFVLCVYSHCVGEACIKWGDEWLLPQQFEEEGGKGSSKKWKATIYCEDKPLQFWFEVTLLCSLLDLKKRSYSC